MGAACDPHLLHPQTSFQAADTPLPAYALPVQQPPRPPLSSQLISALHQGQPLAAPPDYHEHGILLHDYYLINHFDIYYFGQWRRGLPHGKGKVITRNNEYFEGFFFEGVAKGPECLFLISPSNYYLGAVERNQRTGRGRFVDGPYQYEGNWLNNLPHGQGAETYPNGDSYEGTFMQGTKEGQGLYTWKKGYFQSFQGNLKAGELSGQGRLKLRDGTIWNGEFDCEIDFSIQNGECSVEGSIFRGCIQNGRPLTQFTVYNSQDHYQLELRGSKLTGKTKRNEGLVIVGDSLLKSYDEATPHQAIASIIRAVEGCYSKAQRHSQALVLIAKALPSFEFSLWKEGSPHDGVVIIPICGKFIRVVQK